MPLPRLDDYVARMDAVIRKTLMEPIRYSLGGSGFTDIDAHVDYRDALRSIDSGQVIEQDITVQVYVADLPEKPLRSHRVMLPKVGPEISFRPINVRREESGDLWEFELEQVDV